VLLPPLQVPTDSSAQTLVNLLSLATSNLPSSILFPTLVKLMLTVQPLQPLYRLSIPSPRLSLVSSRSTPTLLLPPLLFFGINPSSLLKLMVIPKPPRVVNGKVSLVSEILSLHLVKNPLTPTTSSEILPPLLTSISSSP
jgi:hypothetical protein